VWQSIMFGGITGMITDDLTAMTLVAKEPHHGVDRGAYGAGRVA
jgi:hypothetical protein